MKKLKSFLVVALILATFGSNAQAWDWWNGIQDVIPNHTATVNVSTISQLQTALNNASAGDVIYLATGTYSGTPIMDNRQGTAQSPIIITANPDLAFPIITGGFKIENSDYWEVSNLQLQQSAVTQCFMIGIYENLNSVTPKPCHHWKIDNCEITNGKQAGIHVYNSSSYGTIKNTKLWDLGQASKYCEYIYIGSGSSIGATANNITIEGCEFWDFPEEAVEAIDAKPGTYNITIRNNYIHDARVTHGTTAIGLGTGGHASGQTYPTDANYICENNRFLNIKQGNGTAFQGCIGVGMGSATIRNNVIINCDREGIRVAKGISAAGDTKHVIIENNTIWNSTNYSIDLNAWNAGDGDRTVHFTYDISGNIVDRAMNIALGDNVIASAANFEAASSSPYDKGDGALSGFFPKTSATNIVNAYTVSSNVTKDIIGTTRPTASGMADYGAFEVTGGTSTTYALTVTNGSGDGNYTAGTSVNISADAAPSGQQFDKWTGDVANVVNINNASTTIDMPASVTSVSASYKDASTGTDEVTSISGSLTVEQGQTVTVSVGYTATETRDVKCIFQLQGDPWTHFDESTQTVNAGSGTLEFNLAIPSSQAIGSDYVYIAYITKVDSGWSSRFNFITTGTVEVTEGSGDPEYTLTVNATNGSVSKSPNQATYNGETVTLTATANSGYQFDNWSGDASGTSTTATVTMSSNKTVTANFSEVAAGTDEVTSISGSLTVEQGQTVTVSVEYTATETRDVKCIFQLQGDPWTHYAESTQTVNAGSGTLEFNLTIPSSQAIGSDYVYIAYITKVDSGWSSNFNYKTTGTVEVTEGSGDPEYTLTINATNGSVSKSPNQATYNGETVTLTATANSGYQFDNWSGDASGTSTTATVTMSSNKTVTANFSEIPTSNGYQYLKFIAETGSNIKINEIDWMVGSTSYPTAAMTSNNSAGAIASGGAGSLAYKAFDNDVTNHLWVGNATPYEFVVNLGSAIDVTGVRVTRGEWSTLTSFTAHGSNDGANWTLLHTETGLSLVSSDDAVEVTFSTTKSAESSFVNSELKLIPNESYVYPNLGSGLFNFNFSSNYKGDILINVYNYSGRLIEELKLQKQEGTFIHQIDLLNQASGIYIIQFRAGDYQSIQQVIKN